MRDPEPGTAPLLPVHVQQRADAELGAAWRRCEAALAEGHHGLALARHVRLVGNVRSVIYEARSEAIYASGDEPEAVLTALAARLEAL